MKLQVLLYSCKSCWIAASPVVGKVASTVVGKAVIPVVSKAVRPVVNIVVDLGVSAIVI